MALWPWLTEDLIKLVPVGANKKSTYWKTAVIKITCIDTGLSFEKY